MNSILVMLLTLLTMPAYAQGVAVQGVGTFSCGEYLEHRSKDNPTQDAIFVSWAWGFLAGLNLESPKATSEDLPDKPSTLAYIDKYCRENPLDSVIKASLALFKQLGGVRTIAAGSP